MNAHTTPAGRPLVRRIGAAALAGLLIAGAGLAPWPLSWRLPAGPRAAFASAPLEDCDLDGYDDHTGAPVPWAGFDATRGDSIPSGWDGAANSWTGEHTNDGSTSGRAGSGGSSGGSTSVNSGRGGSSSSASGSGGTSAAGRATNTGSGATSVNGQTVVVSTPATATAPIAGAVVVASLPDTRTILATRGTIGVADTQGALIHLGGSIRIDGAGFAPFSPGLQLWIDAIPVGRVSVDDSGAFTEAVRLPAGIAVGAHRVVVTYGGSHLAHLRVDVGPRPADSFLRALVVGFSDTNPQRDTGAILLAALAAAGVVAYGSRALIRRPGLREVR